MSLLIYGVFGTSFRAIRYSTC